MPICAADGCRQPILENEQTIRFAPGTLVRGKKSGNLYHSDTFEVEILIHYGCLFRYFYADAEMYDIFYGRVHKQVRQEQYDDLKQEAYSEAAQDLHRLCPECLSNRTEDPDKPPEEYECSCGSGALPVCPDCGETSDLAVDLFIKDKAA